MATRRKRMARSQKFLKVLFIIGLIVIIVAVAAVLYLRKFKPDLYNRYYQIVKEQLFGEDDRYQIAAEETLSTSLTASGNLQIHFPELGNKYAGDCIYIKAGDTDILIDAGSRTGSVGTISEYINKYVTDGKLEYVIVTHAHEDHYAGFATSQNTDSIFDLYECGVIIDFAKTNQKESAQMYRNYQRELSEEISSGAEHYTAAECRKNGNYKFRVADGIEIEILDSYYYYNTSSGENDYSVCVMINQGDRHYLFTGDLEEKGEKYLTQMNDLPKVVLYKAGHHGSKTSSSEELLSVIKPEIVCVCCVAGSDEYTKTKDNQFPTQKFIDNVSKYTTRVYVTSLFDEKNEDGFTSMNGCIIICSDSEKIMLRFTKNNIRLKDTEWFKNNRTTPVYWK